jgi:hypothetical protein
MPAGPGDLIQVEDKSGDGRTLHGREGCGRYVFLFAPIAD